MLLPLRGTLVSGGSKPPPGIGSPPCPAPFPLSPRSPPSAPASVTNVDRTPRNPNLLWWHKALYLIDHGASLYFHHNWPSLETMARSRFTAIRDHVLLPWASRLEEADRSLRPRLDVDLFRRVV